MFRKSIFLFFVFFSIQQGFSQNQDNSSKKIDVFIEDVYFDGQDIYVRSNGKDFPIQSLEKTLTGWKAQVDHLFPWCAQGHPACPSCESCHRPDCYFYVPSCTN